MRASARVERLLLVLVLVYWWLHGLGSGLIRAGQRARFDRPNRRDCSRRRLGWLWFQHLEAEHCLPPLLCRGTPTGWVYRWTR